MPKRTLFTNVTPLPPQVSRELAISVLHDHDEMIELNPLVIEHHPIKAPRYAPADEFLACAWQELTDRVHYLPGGMVKRKVSYKAAFHNLPNGLQTHTYAPMGLDIREKWTIGGSLPGELPEARELGVNTPPIGLYLREDCDMKCNVMLANMARKNLDNAHKILVERIMARAIQVENYLQNSPSIMKESTTGFTVSRGSPPLPTSQLGEALEQDIYPSPDGSPIRGLFVDSLLHPAFRNDPDFLDNLRNGSTHDLPSYQPPIDHSNQYPQDVKHNPYIREETPKPFNQRRQLSLPVHFTSTTSTMIIAELPGSIPYSNRQSHSDPQSRRASVSEISVLVDNLRPKRSTYKSQVSNSEGSSPISESSAPPNWHYRSDSWSNGRRVLDFTSDEYINPSRSFRHTRSFDIYCSQPVELPCGSLS